MLEGFDPITVVTLGPSGTCHERASTEYMRFQEVGDFEMIFIRDFLKGLEMVRRTMNSFLIQCSAHPLVHEVTERHRTEVFVVDTFIYPTKPLAILGRRDVQHAKTLGLVPATAGYIDEHRWDSTVSVDSKPIVARELLAGRFDAGLTHLEHLEAHPEDLRLIEAIGEVDTSWVVYGSQRRFQGSVIGIPSPELFAEGKASADK
jgi:hypothetical protein